MLLSAGVGISPVRKIAHSMPIFSTPSLNILSSAELYFLEKLCAEKNKTAKILFRITPGVMSDTHEYITTGKKDSKFGIPLNEDILYPAIESAIKSDNFDFLGFHFHVGSQLQDTTSHLGALEVGLF